MAWPGLLSTRIERNSKLALAHHVGRHTSEDASIFTAKLAAATSGEFQLSTDGFNGYPGAIEQHLGGRVDYGMLVKTYSSETVDAERRYSPAQIISAEKVVVSGAPLEERICTSHLARRADEPAHPHVGAPVHPSDERFQPEAGQPAGRAGAPLRGLQLHLDAPLDPLHARHGRRDCPQALDGAGPADGLASPAYSNPLQL
jgi:hypothetical protein